LLLERETLAEAELLALAAQLAPAVSGKETKGV